MKTLMPIFVGLLMPAMGLASNANQELLIGIYTNDIILIDKAIGDGADINMMPQINPGIGEAGLAFFKEIKPELGFTPLIWALEYSDAATVEALVQRGAKPDPNSVEAKALQTLLELCVLSSACDFVSMWSDYASRPVEEKLIGKDVSLSSSLWFGYTLGAWRIRPKVLKTQFRDPFGNKLVLPSIAGPFSVSSTTAEASISYTQKFSNFWGRFAPKD